MKYAPSTSTAAVNAQRAAPSPRGVRPDASTIAPAPSQATIEIDSSSRTAMFRPSQYPLIP